MNTYAEKNQEKGNKVANSLSKQQRCNEATFQLVDNRATTVAQRELAETINSSPRQVAQHQQINNLFGNAAQLQSMDEEELQLKTDSTVLQRTELEEEELLQGQFKTAQRQEDLEEEELLQGKFETLQRQRDLEEEELLQGKFDASPMQHEQNDKPNKTGLPDNLKAGIENLSGYSMDDVSVHYNSPKPAQIQAHAYAQGSDIHLASGQEKHLPHEAWHLVQQKQGRVKPTMQMNGGVNVNDDIGLEKDADVMGKRAERFLSNVKAQQKAYKDNSTIYQTVQRLKIRKNPDKKKDANIFFRLRDSEGDAESCAHNYAFINGVESIWAKSSGSGHAETQLTGLYAKDEEDLHIVSELHPCDPCQKFLPKVEKERDMKITVYYNLPYKDTGEGNKGEILKMYQGYRWLSSDSKYATYILTQGEEVLDEE